MKYFLILALVFFLLLSIKTNEPETASNYDVYQYVKDCKAELGITTVTVF